MFMAGKQCLASQSEADLDIAENDRALNSYRRSLGLYLENTGAKQMIERIDGVRQTHW